MPKGMHRKIVGLGMERMVKTVRNKQQGHQKEPSKAAIVKKPNKKLEIRGKEGGGRIANGKIVKYSQAPRFVPKVLPAERIHSQQKKEQANPPNPPNTKSEGKGRIAHIPKAQHFPHGTKNEESIVAVNSFIRKQSEIERKYAQLNKTANAINGIGHNGTVSNGPSKFSWRETSPGIDKENIGNNNGPLKREDSNGNGGGGHPWP